MNKYQVYDELTKRGVTKAVVSFSGGGDDGGVNDITLLNAAGEVVGKLEEYYGGNTYDPATKKWIPSTPPTADESLATALGEPVYGKYHTFAGEFYVSGEVVWDAVARTVKMSGSAQVSHDEEFEDDL